MRIKATRGKGPRLYNAGRGLVPSVTEVLSSVEKRYLEAWRHRVGTKVADAQVRDAQAFGTKLHSAAQRVAWGEFDKVDEDMKPYAEAVRQWIRENVADVMGTEMDFASVEQRFGGTLDLYCRLKDGSMAVVDWKTSASLNREMGLQLAAYALLCREHGLTINKRLVVRIKKEAPGKFYARHYEDHARDVQGFRGLLDYWWWAHDKAMRERMEKHVQEHEERKGVA